MRSAKPRIHGAPPPNPYEPPEYEKADVAAFQAWARGDASKEQQQRAFLYVVEKIAGTYDLSYRPGVDGDRDTAFAEGKRYVGLQIVKLVRINIGRVFGGEPREQP